MLDIGEKEIEAVARVIRGKQLFRYGERKAGKPSECVKFEQSLAAAMGTEHALVVTSGTAALMCGLAGLGIGPGDEIIIPAYTFMASALAPLSLGAIPVLAEIDDSLTMDPGDAAAKITPRTKAIMPVHMCGFPANMNAIMKLARRHSIPVLEDACQADGGSYRGKRLGAIGNAGAYSFNYYKNMTSGEGGAVVTNDKVCYERALIFHDGGCVFRPRSHELGVPFFAGSNFRMNEILAAILRVQLRRLDGMLARTRARKQTLLSGIAGHPRLRPIRSNDSEGDCGTTVGLRFPSESEARAFISRLGERGVTASTPIDSDRHVYCNWEPVMERRGSYHPKLDAFRRPENAETCPEYQRDMCPRTLEVLRTTVFIPITLQQTMAEVRRIARSCREVADTLD
jgi:dTDP-4-amino-4,6-dideoxygalactose transaminase